MIFFVVAVLLKVVLDSISDFWKLKIDPHL